MHSGYTFFISMCVPWESNPQPFALLTQCSTTEPQEHAKVVPSLLGFRHDVQGSRKVAKIAHLHLRLSNDILVHLYSSRPSLWDYFTVRRAKIAHLIAQKSTSAPLLNKPHDLRYHSCSKHKPCEMHNTPHLLFNTFFMQVVSQSALEEKYVSVCAQ